MTNYSRSVLKSNGLPRPKIRLKKFGFSLKIVPANIVRKLPSQRCFKPLFIASFNFSHKRRNVRFKGLRRVHTPPQLLTAHTAAHTRKQGVFQMVGAITTLGPFRTVRNRCARSGQKSILCHLCMDRGNVGEKQRAFGTETRTVRVSVPRRRGPAGSRCSTAVSCAAPVSFAVRYHCDEGQRGKFVNVTVVILFVV